MVGDRWRGHRCSRSWGDDPALAVPDLSDDEIADLVAFLGALTDPAAADLGHLVPERVPSGLPVDR